jgi:hypothetical protein
VDPESFAVEDMHDLCPERWEPEARNFFRIVTFRDCRQMIEDQREAGMSPAVQLTHSDDSEQEESPGEDCKAKPEAKPEGIGRVPHVRLTCPGVPWGVHGPKEMGAAQRSSLYSIRKLIRTMIKFADGKRGRRTQAMAASTI